MLNTGFYRTGVSMTAPGGWDALTSVLLSPHPLPRPIATMTSVGRTNDAEARCMVEFLSDAWCPRGGQPARAHEPTKPVDSVIGWAMLSRTPLAVCVWLVSSCLVGCGSDGTGDVTVPSTDGGLDAMEVDAAKDVAVETEASVEAGPDAPPDAAPSSCEQVCSTACESNGEIEGECASCVDSVCDAYRTRAQNAPNREALFTCFSGCGTDPDCPNACCGKYPQACAWEIAYDMCKCGFREQDCSSDCIENCDDGALTEACGVCGSQSPCSYATFEYLFSPSRFAHQDCVATCASSALTRDECLDLCRDDYAEASVAYDSFLACVCEQ